MRCFFVEENHWKREKGHKKYILLQGKKDLLSAGGLVQLLSVDSETSVPPHCHLEGLEVFHILRGKGIMKINDETFHLKRGDTLTCEPREVHSAENPYDEPFEYIIFKTDGTIEEDNFLKSPQFE